MIMHTSKQMKYNFIHWVCFFMMLFFGACVKEVKIPDQVESKPSTIGGIRKINLDRNFTFGNTAILGIVTVDPQAGNVHPETLIVQSEDEEAAIVIHLQGDNQTFTLHQEVSIDLKGSLLKVADGELTIENLPLNQIKPTGKIVGLTPKITNIPTIQKEASYWGPIVLRLEKIQLSGPGGKLSGTLTLDDGVSTIKSDIRSTAVFKEENRPDYVESYTGILRKKDGDIYINPRNLKDIQIGQKELLEDFEEASSTNYNVKTLEFRTGSWTIDGGITASTAADLKHGKQSIRLQGTIGNEQRNGIIAMEFDVLGVQTISVSHGIYPASAETSNVNPTVFDIEVSRDGGKTYTLLRQVEVDIHSGELKTEKVNVNAGFDEALRFRIVNSSIPFNNNNRPRISIDDIFFEF